MIGHLLKRKGLTQSRLAKNLGIRPSSVNQWVNGRTQVDKKHLPALARELGISIDDLLAVRIGEGAPNVESGVGAVRANDSSLYTYVPYLSAKAQAGIPELIFEGCQLNWIEETYAVIIPEELKKKETLVIDIVGESMEPRILNGAKVLAVHVPTGDIKYESGGVYAVMYANRFVIKRIKTNTLMTSSILTLHSDNPNYGEILVQAEDIQCIWKVVGKVWEPL